MAQILVVGIATLDIIHETSEYPVEDSEVRALSELRRRGGNATNTAVVLSQLGHRVTWAGVGVNEPDYALIRNELNNYGICLDYVQYVENGKLPTSYVTLSRSTGSRSIVHYRDCPELSFNHFSSIPLEPFDWIHFEGRNVEETEKMLQHCRTIKPHLVLSLEAEKPREYLSSLFPLVDVILTGKHFANAQGFQTPQDCLNFIRSYTKSAKLVCTWGTDDSIMLDQDGNWYSEQVNPLSKVIDSIGAGDTFNAAFIDACLLAKNNRDCLKVANSLAEKKCSQYGFTNLID